MASISTADFTRAVLVLLEEGHVGPGDARSTWFVENAPDAGFLRTLEGIPADLASRPAVEGGATIAAHANHLRYSLELANRAARGENPYAGADWAGSWKLKQVSEPEWKALTASLRAEYERIREAIAGGQDWADFQVVAGTLGVIAHGAYHLGAIRQMLRVLRAGR
jgi:hypothetical protein